MRKISFFVYVLIIPALVCLAGLSLKSTTAKAASATTQTVLPAPMNWNDGSVLLVPEIAKALVVEKVGNIDFPDAKAQLERAPKSKLDEKTVKDAIYWVTSMIMQPGWVAPKIEEHWIPIKGWVDTLDVFIVRYVINGHNVQVIYNRTATTIIISPLVATAQPVSTHAAYLKKMAFQVLRIPTTYSFIGKAEGDVSWGALLEWPIKEKPIPQGQYPSKAVRAITDGNFVVFSIGGPIHAAAPYTLVKPLFDQPVKQPAVLPIITRSTGKPGKLILTPTED